MFLAFPEFNFYSAPLLLLTLQGLLFALLLLLRFLRKKYYSDLFLFLILMITCYHQVCYTLGFMGWYDTFRTTKINYALLWFSIALLPLIYLYVKSITRSSFHFRKKDWLHFLPAFVMIIYRITIFLVDAQQANFDTVQNGSLKLQLDEPIVLPLYSLFGYLQNLVYLAFTFQLFFDYRRKIKAYFSNTYKLELTWILSFLVLYGLLYVYDLTQTIISEFVMDLSYIQRWWMTLFTGLIIIYVGIKGYFTDTSTLQKLDFSFTPTSIGIPEKSLNSTIKVSEATKERLKNLMDQERPYLNPDLNLSDLAKMANMGKSQLSETINLGFDQNFNDFVNHYRVAAFKQKLKSESAQKLSLLGLAYECGFNSKATFNRVFKKLTSASPSEYLRTLS